MQLLPKQTRVNTDDAIGHGMDATIMLGLFLAAGFGLDRLFGTMPVFMIASTVVGSVGLFLKFKYRYDLRMSEHDDERLARSGRRIEANQAADSHADAPGSEAA
jgi:ATP synthase protein I